MKIGIVWKPLVVILLTLLVIQGFIEPTPVINNIEYKDYNYKIVPTFNITVNQTLKNDTYINNTYIDNSKHVVNRKTVVPPVIVQSFNNTTLVTNLNETVNNNEYNNETVNNYDLSINLSREYNEYNYYKKHDCGWGCN
jgi:hypothetical protein